MCFCSVTCTETLFLVKRRSRFASLTRVVSLFFPPPASAWCGGLCWSLILPSDQTVQHSVREKRGNKHAHSVAYIDFSTVCHSNRFTPIVVAIRIYRSWSVPKRAYRILALARKFAVRNNESFSKRNKILVVNLFPAFEFDCTCIKTTNWIFGRSHMCTSTVHSQVEQNCLKRQNAKARAARLHDGFVGGIPEGSNSKIKQSLLQIPAQ
jgi:hypothetical protein